MHHSDRNAHVNKFRAAPTNKPWKRSRKRRVTTVIRWAIIAVVLAATWSIVR